MDLNEQHRSFEKGYRSRVEIVQSFYFYKAVLDTYFTKDSEIISCPNLGEASFSMLKGDHYHQVYHHFPIVILPNSEPWYEAYSFLSSLIMKQDEYSRLPSVATMEKKARNLVKFADFVIENGIDFSQCKRKFDSPLRRFKYEMNERMALGLVAPNTLKVLMSNLVEFYRFLVNSEKMIFDFPPWEEKEQTIYINTNRGKGVVKKVAVADVSKVKGRYKKTEDAGYEGHIVDGGYLRPLEVEEQIILVNSLVELENTEMSLVHAIGLLGGARKQTVLTLRRHQFLSEPVLSPDGEVRILAGPHPRSGVLADCKDSGRNYKLEKYYIPKALFEKIRVYLMSPRALNRLDKAHDKYPIIGTENQYVFLSQQGNSMYVGKTDPYRADYRQLPNGQALETFIRDRLYPLMKKKGFNQSFRYHDTRASFGMNLVRRSFAEHPDWTVGRIINHTFSLVRSRLNHTSFDTTQQYLEFEEKHELVKAVQVQYEEHLLKLMDRF